MKDIDFGRTTKDYSTFRAGFPESFFERLAERDLLKRGIRALDLGTGTGTVARGMAKLGVTVTACDISEEMIEQARRIDADNGIEITYLCARAEDTSLPDQSFDLVTCGQCWHWFDGAE